MNHMKEVAALLGVELNEEFELIFSSSSDCHATLKLTVEGVKVISTDIYDIFNFKSNLLEHLIKGSYGIKHKPFKPKYGNGYWTYNYYDDFDTEPRPINFKWSDSSWDYILYYLGLCFRTEEEAEQNKDKLQKIINHYKES